MHRGAGMLVWYRRCEWPRPVSDLLAFAIASPVPFDWAVILSMHTGVHASFMSRMLIAPVALGATAFMYQAYQVKRTVSV
jgi:hypothetical protein